MLMHFWISAPSEKGLEMKKAIKAEKRQGLKIGMIRRKSSNKIRYFRHFPSFSFFLHSSQNSPEVGLSYVSS